MLRHLLAATVAVVSFAAPASAQLYFRDNFGTTGNLNGRVPSPGPGGTYSATVPTNATASSPSGALVLANTTATNGNVYGSATIGNGFTSLNALPRWIEWRFNMRSSVTPTGMDGTEFGLATVLAASSTNLDTADGYAVVYRVQGGNVQLQLVRFTGGLDADSNITNIINSGANPLGTATDFASFRITYNPVGNNWQFFFRDDGAIGFTDPYSGGAFTQIGGTVSDNTFVGAGVNQVGAYFSYGSGSQTATFDNFTIAAVPEPTTWALIGLSAAGLIGGVYRYRRGAAKTLNTEVDVEANEVA